MLGYPELRPDAQLYFEAMFELLQIIPVSAEIIAAAVQFGRLYRLRAADAIIAASAWLHGRALVSEDGHFRRVPGLDVVNSLAAVTGGQGCAVYADGLWPAHPTRC